MPAGRPKSSSNPAEKGERPEACQSGRVRDGITAARSCGENGDARDKGKKTEGSGVTLEHYSSQ